MSCIFGRVVSCCCHETTKVERSRLVRTGWIVSRRIRKLKRPHPTSRLRSIGPHIWLVFLDHSLSLRLCIYLPVRPPLGCLQIRETAVDRTRVSEKFRDKFRTICGSREAVAARSRASLERKRKGRKGMSNHRQLFGIPEDVTTCTRLIDAPRPIPGR